ncbi:MAG TPA: amidohydrolase family protein [Terriglobia bacterium]|nr:amidohydrolase family protein [Terriglobia bacterium]
MIDTNVSLFRWPFRRLIGDEPAELVARLREKGVTQAWAASFEGLFCRDVAGVNARLAGACREHGRKFLVPFGCVNPKLPDWQEDLRRCHEVHRMPGIRVHPNYHGYALDDPAFAELVSIAAKRGVLIQIALSMEDPRTQFPLMQVPPVDPAPLADLLPRIPKLRLVLLNAGYMGGTTTPHISRIKEAGNVWFDMAMNERVGGLARLVEETSSARVVFGSHYPFFYFESALLKVRSAGLPRDQERAITEENARSLLNGQSQHFR